MSEPITANVNPPSPMPPRPPRPEMYALAVYDLTRVGERVRGWTLYYAGAARSWIEGSQQPLHPGSFLVIVPAE